MHLESLLVPQVKLSEERPIDVNDYRDYVCESSEQLAAGVEDFDIVDVDIITAIIFVAEHSPHPESKYDEESMCWSSKCHSSAADNIKTKIEKRQQTSFQELIRDNLNDIFVKLEPKLKDWIEQPASCHACVYLIHQMSYQLIEDYLGKLLPYILRWSDSWMIRPRLLAARAFDVILDIPSSYLTKFGREKVIYDTLIKALSTQDACTLEVAASPLIKVLGIICKEENKVSISQIDDFISKLFTSIDVDTTINRKILKVDLLANAWNLLEQAGNRWIPRLACLIAAELDIVDSVTTKVLLGLWRQVCDQYPAPAARESKTIFPPLVKALWKICEGYFNENPVVEIDEVILTLSKQILLDPDIFEVYIKDMKEVTKNQRFLEALNTAKCLS